jgi:hypothetical protein
MLEMTNPELSECTPEDNDNRIDGGDSRWNGADSAHHRRHPLTLLHSQNRSEIVW